MEGRDVPALAAGGTSTATTTLLIPDWNPAAGAYFLIASADDAAQTESREKNNLKVRALVID